MCTQGRFFHLMSQKKNYVSTEITKHLNENKKYLNGNKNFYGRFIQTYIK